MPVKPYQIGSVRPGGSTTATPVLAQDFFAAKRCLFSFYKRKIILTKKLEI